MSDNKTNLRKFNVTAMERYLTKPISILRTTMQFAGIFDEKYLSRVLPGSLNM